MSAMLSELGPRTPRPSTRSAAWARGAGLAVGAVAVAVASGCAASDNRDVALPPDVVNQPNPEGVYGGDVTAAQALTGRTIELTMTPINADQNCNTDPTATVTEQQPGVVYVTTTYRVSSPACPSSTLTLTLALNDDLEGRLLVIDQQAWVLDPSGATTGSLRQCDPTFGCDPKPAACDDEAYRLALDSGDFPRNGRTWTQQACRVPWLILDVDTTASGCAATGDDPGSNPCLSGPRRVTRWVFTQRGPLWDTVATLPLGGGCGQEPPSALPRELCASLPPAATT